MLKKNTLIYNFIINNYNNALKVLSQYYDYKNEDFEKALEKIDNVDLHVKDYGESNIITDESGEKRGRPVEYSFFRAFYFAEDYDIRYPDRIGRDPMISGVFFKKDNLLDSINIFFKDKYSYNIRKDISLLNDTPKLKTYVISLIQLLDQFISKINDPNLKTDAIPNKSFSNKKDIEETIKKWLTIISSDDNSDFKKISKLIDSYFPIERGANWKHKAPQMDRKNIVGIGDVNSKGFVYDIINEFKNIKQDLEEKELLKNYLFKLDSAIIKLQNNFTQISREFDTLYNQQNLVNKNEVPKPNYMYKVIPQNYKYVYYLPQERSEKILPFFYNKLPNKLKEQLDFIIKNKNTSIYEYIKNIAENKNITVGYLTKKFWFFIDQFMNAQEKNVKSKIDIYNPIIISNLNKLINNELQSEHDLKSETKSEFKPESKSEPKPESKLEIESEPEFKSKSKFNMFDIKSIQIDNQTLNDLKNKLNNINNTINEISGDIQISNLIDKFKPLLENVKKIRRFIYLNNKLCKLNWNDRKIRMIKQNINDKNELESLYNHINTSLIDNELQNLNKAIYDKKSIEDNFSLKKLTSAFNMLVIIFIQLVDLIN